MEITEYLEPPLMEVEYISVALIVELFFDPVVDVLLTIITGVIDIFLVVLEVLIPYPRDTDNILLNTRTTMEMEMEIMVMKIMMPVEVLLEMMMIKKWEMHPKYSLDQSGSSIS